MQKSDPEDRFLSPATVANCLDVNVNAVYRLVKEQRVDAIRNEKGNISIPFLEAMRLLAIRAISPGPMRDRILHNIDYQQGSIQPEIRPAPKPLSIWERQTEPRTTKIIHRTPPIQQEAMTA